MNAELLDHIPKGFTLEPGPGDTVVIRYRRTRMGCMANVFPLSFLSIWGTICVMMLWGCLFGASTAGRIIVLFLIPPFWGGAILVAGFVLARNFARRTFRLDGDQLIHELRCPPFFCRRRLIPRESIQTLIQIRDADEDDEDISSSWGLRVEVIGNPTSLMWNQSYEKSEWLGRVLAQWAEVPYLPAPKE